MLKADISDPVLNGAYRDTGRHYDVLLATKPNKTTMLWEIAKPQVHMGIAQGVRRRWSKSPNAAEIERTAQRMAREVFHQRRTDCAGRATEELFPLLWPVWRTGMKGS